MKVRLLKDICNRLYDGGEPYWSEIPKGAEGILLDDEHIDFDGKVHFVSLSDYEEIDL